MKKKILAIVRTSTERQETESQKHELVNMCISKGYAKKDIIFIEAKGASARKADKEYLEFIEKIKTTLSTNKDVKAVAMWHLNRLGRKEKYLNEMKLFFIDNNIQVYVKEPTLTLFNEDGTINVGSDMAWNLFANMIKYDTMELMEKTKRGRESNRREMKFNGGAFGALFGYMVNDGGFIVPNPKEVETLTDVYQMYASGKYSIRSLTKELQERGYNMRGRKFTENNLAKVLANTAYIGYSDKTERKYHPIINDALWHKVESVRKQNDIGIRKTKESRNINLAIKLLKCQYCGHNYVATKNKYTCYKHVMAARFTDNCENSVSISIKLLDTLLWDVAQFEHIDFMQKDAEIHIKELNTEKAIIMAKREQAKKDIEKLAPSKERATELYVNGDISRQKYDQMKANTKTKENELKANIKAYNLEIKHIDANIENFQNFDVERFVNMACDIQEITNKKEMKDIVNQHIKECFVNRVVYNNRKAIEITINCYNGNVRNYLYLYTLKEKEKQLYEIHSDGRVLQYFQSFDDTNKVRLEDIENEELQNNWKSIKIAYMQEEMKKKEKLLRAIYGEDYEKEMKKAKEEMKAEKDITTL